MTTYRFCDDDDKKMDYLAGVLNSNETAKVATHLAECPACRSELAELAALGVKLAQLPAPICPPELVQGTIDLLIARDELERRVRIEQKVILGLLGSTALTILLLLLGGVIPGLAVAEFGPNLPSNSGMLRNGLVLLLLMALPSGLDNLGFLVLRRRLIAI